MDKDLEDKYLNGLQKSRFSTHPYDRWDGERDIKDAFIEQHKRDKRKAMNEYFESQKIFSPLYRLQNKDD